MTTYSVSLNGHQIRLIDAENTAAAAERYGQILYRDHAETITVTADGIGREGGDLFRIDTVAMWTGRTETVHAEVEKIRH